MGLNRGSLENTKADLKKNKTETWMGRASADKNRKVANSGKADNPKVTMEIKLNPRCRINRR